VESFVVRTGGEPSDERRVWLQVAELDSQVEVSCGVAHALYTRALVGLPRLLGSRCAPARVRSKIWPS